ncbi:MAG TPA: FtsX-like permease family protein [Clostridia bacterium]|nr:FtsX-like permease family protein [Clostridia bacterium]
MFLSIGIAIGIATIVALLTLTSAIQEEIGSQLDQFGANIVIAPKSNNIALDYGGVAIPGVTFDVQELRDDDVQRIRSIAYHSRLSVIAPKVLSVAEVEGTQTLIAGVDFKSELRLKRWWRITGDQPTNAGDLLVGFEVARRLGAVHIPDKVDDAGHQHGKPSPGDELHLLRRSVMIAGSQHRIAGVIGDTGGPEDRMIFGDLRQVQELANKQGHLDLIEVSALCKGCPIDDIVAQIQQQLPNAKVSAIQQAVRARTEMVDRLTKFSSVISAVVLLIGALLIFTTMTSSVVERTKEIGVLRALGFRRMHVVQQFLTEIAVISFVGGFLGWFVGSAAGRLALPYFTDSGMKGSASVIVLLASIASSLVVGMSSSIYPALRASRMEPSDAVRYV